MKFEEIYELRTEKRLSVEQAACMLGMSERNLRRYVRRYEGEGMDGLNDKRLAKAAHNAAPVDEVIALVDLYQTHYWGYNLSHFFDKYRSRHQGSRSYNWVRNKLQTQGVVQACKKRGVHRHQRPRQPI